MSYIQAEMSSLLKGMASQVRQEKAAGCYPWTHLTHNEEEEVVVQLY